MARLPLLPPNIDEKRLVLAIITVLGFGIFILALQFILPLLGIFAAFGVIAAAAYGIYVYLTRKP